MTEPLKTESNAVVASRVIDSLRFAPNPIPQLTPANLASYLDGFARGYLRDAAILWNSIQWRDDRVGADSNKRHKSVPRYGYRLVAAPGQKSDSPQVKKHMDAIAFALDNLSATDVLDPARYGGLSMLTRQMMHAVGMQYQVHELVWQPRPDGITLKAIGMPLWWFERTTGELRFLQHDFDLYGTSLEENGWMITHGDGIMAATSLLYLLKRLATTDWVLYNGRIGPGIHGKTSASIDSPEWKALEQAVDNFSFDLKLVSGDGVTLTPIEMALKGTLPWPAMYELAVRAITVLWRGGNLMSESGKGPSESGVTLQGSESLILEQDDAQMISDALNDYIVIPLIRHRFGDAPLAWVEWKTGVEPDLKSEMLTDEFLARRGWPFSIEDLSRRYQRMPPKAGEIILTPPSTNSPIISANEQSEILNPKSQMLPDPVEVARQKLVAQGVAETEAARRRMLEDWFAKLEASLPEKATPSEYIALVQAALAKMPKELLTPENVSELATIMEGTLGSTVVNALLSAKTPEPKGGAA